MDNLFFAFLLLSIPASIIFLILLFTKWQHAKKALAITGIVFGVSFVGFAATAEGDGEETAEAEELPQVENDEDEEDIKEGKSEDASQEVANNDIEGDVEEDDIVDDTEDEPTLEISVDEFRENFDAVAGEFELTYRSNKDAEIVDGDVYDTQPLITASDHVNALATLTKGGDIVALNLVGSGDGTQESGFEILASIGAMIGAVEPNFTAGERGEILAELGILDEGGISVGLKQVENGGILYSFNKTEDIGIMFFVEPAE